MDWGSDKHRDYLKDEYLMLMNNYEDFDRRSLTIKGWVSTGAVAGLALAFGKDIPKEITAAGALFVATLAVTFWILEANWKLFQSALQDRVRTIEAYFRGDESVLVYTADGKDLLPLAELAPFQAYNAWNRSLRDDLPIYDYERNPRPGRPERPTPRPKRMLATALRGNVLFPYAIILVFALAALAYQAFR